MFDSEKYPDFISENDGIGTLKVQVYTANQAYPLADVEIKIVKEINNNTVTFFTGKTNSSGIIDNISLPAKKPLKEIESALDITYTTYLLTATNPYTKQVKDFEIAVFAGMKIIQPINFSSMASGI